MRISRRHFIQSSAIVAAGVTLLPFAARAGGHSANVFSTGSGDVTINPISHASFVMQSPVGNIYVDPVGDAAAYSDMPPADLVLITHEHGDHYNEETLAGIVGDNTVLITNPAVFEKLSEGMKAKASQVANGESTTFNGMTIDAIAAYNTTEERLNFHPKGRDNGYVLTIDDFRVYISGDTEDIPEMRALENIDLAFVCMNLPFTMDVAAAASAVSEFKPSFVYPYHYRGRDNGTQDPMEFANLLGDAIEVKMGGWYG